MAGIQISGLVSGLNWTNIISEIIVADSAGMNQVQAQQTKVNSQVTALTSLGTDLTNLEASIFSLEDPGTFSAVTAASTTGGSTWQVTAANSTPIGNTNLNVTRLASSTLMTGAAQISQGLSPTADVSGETVANLGLGQPVTAGTFSINGAQVAVTTSESLQDVFTAISTATGGNVTATYDPTTDKVTMASASGPVVLGADNDSSNFLSSLELENNGTSSVSSATALGALLTGVPLASTGFATPLSGQDSTGAGSFSINGVSIAYNVNTDSLSTVLNHINSSDAGVNAVYDSGNNRILLTNTSTGNTGIGVSDVSGNLAAALGLTSGASTNFGQNATFSVNGGPTQSSASNAFTPAQLGVAGLSVTANSTGPQVIAVTADTTGMQTAIQGFITSFNQLQTDIRTDTAITTSLTGSVSTSILSSDHEVGDWGSQLQMAAFSAGSGVGGAVSSLDSLGIDFNGTTGQLEISDSGKLQQALSSSPSAVAAFFQTAKTGFGSIMNGQINDILGQSSAEVSNFQSESIDLGDQITTMQNSLTSEQQQLESEFTAMEAAEERYQAEEQTLSSLAGSSGGSSTSSLSTAANSSSSASTSSSASSAAG